MKLSGLYAITDIHLTPYDYIERYVAEAARGGAKIVQLRDKTTSDDELYAVAKKIKKICKKTGTTFIINDRAVLAKAVDADGVHIGADDASFGVARAILGRKKIIGVSCYGDMELAKAAAQKGADYVAFGAFFSSKTKPNAQTIDTDILTKARAIDIPVCAIGGIEPSNAAVLASKGAEMLAVISSLWSGDIKKNAQNLSKAFNAK
jgi:thiamine-phosphate pyrophosphorylase